MPESARVRYWCGRLTTRLTILSASRWSHARNLSHGANGQEEPSECADVNIYRACRTAIEQRERRCCKLCLPSGHEDHCEPPYCKEAEVTLFSRQYQFT